MDLVALKSAIKKSEPIVFCRKHLFDTTAWFFQNAADFDAIGNYHDFRFELGTLVNTSPNNVAIIGSAKFGYSLAPGKNFSSFKKSSDIDVVIISPLMFEETWAQFRKALFSGYSWIQDRHSGEIIRKYIVLSGSAQYETGYLRDVAKRMLEMRKTVQAKFSISNTINYRVYPTWDDAELYHVSGMQKLREGL